MENFKKQQAKEALEIVKEQRRIERLEISLPRRKSELELKKVKHDSNYLKEVSDLIYVKKITNISKVFGLTMLLLMIPFWGAITVFSLKNICSIPTSVLLACIFSFIAVMIFATLPFLISRRKEILATAKIIDSFEKKEK